MLYADPCWYRVASHRIVRVNSPESRRKKSSQKGAKVERTFFLVVFVTYRYVKPASSKHNESLTTGIHGARPFAQVICKNHPPGAAEIQEACGWGWLAHPIGSKDKAKRMGKKCIKKKRENEHFFLRSPLQFLSSRSKKIYVGLIRPTKRTFTPVLHKR